MRRLVSHLSLGFLIILLAACASAPKKPAPLSPAQVSKLKSMQLPSRLPVPVKG
ncbi:TPA: M23 family peptidase, partial [Acinetobacter baumannii]